jgi:hypothetical protein
MWHGIRRSNNKNKEERISMPDLSKYVDLGLAMCEVRGV